MISKNKIYLTNIPNNSSALKEEIAKAFSCFGIVEKVQVIKKNRYNNKKLGEYAFLTFKDPQSVQAALSSDKAIKVGNCTVKVNHAIDKSGEKQKTSKKTEAKPKETKKSNPKSQKLSSLETISQEVDSPQGSD